MIIRIFLTVASIALFTGCRSQTATDIVEKYIEVSGGRDLWKALRTVTADFVIKDETADWPGHLVVVEGQGYKLEYTLLGRKSIECYTRDSGWVLNALWYLGLRTLPAKEQIVLRDKLYIQPLVHYKESGATLKLLGKEDNDYMIQYTDTSGFQVLYQIDATTGYLHQETRYVQKNGAVTTLSTTIFENYRKSPEGYAIAYTQHVSGVTGPPLLTVIVKDVKFNLPVDMKIFAFGHSADEE